MSCDAPMQAYRADKPNPATGKRPMIFKVNGSFSGVRLMLPCGKCAGCRLENSRRWAVRIMHESKMHATNTFLTLTYNKECLPTVGTLVPTHLQAFHKRLHNRLLSSRGEGIRYYGCGEYGDLSKRPHYHSIVFGFDFPDKLIYARGERYNVYQSKMLDEVWGMGACKIGEVNFETAAYVARYCMKKVDGAKRDKGHYLVYDADGLVHERVPEFAHMSRRPGIGTSYFEKFGHEIKTHDSIIVSGKEVPSIRYYDLKIEKEDASKMELIKRKRRAKAKWLERQIDRRRVKEKLRGQTLKLKERKL